MPFPRMSFRGDLHVDPPSPHLETRLHFNGAYAVQYSNGVHAVRYGQEARTWYYGSRISHPIRHSQPAYLFPNRITFSLRQRIDTLSFFWASFLFPANSVSQRYNHFCFWWFFFPRIVTSQLQSCEENNTQRTPTLNNCDIPGPLKHCPSRGRKAVLRSSPGFQVIFVVGATLPYLCVNFLNRLAGILLPLFLSQILLGRVR